MKRGIKIAGGCAILLVCSSCHRGFDHLDPKISCNVRDCYLDQLPPAFPPLSPEESREHWGREFLIAQGFAKELDLYRAVTAYKRTEFLLPREQQDRLLEAQYHTLFCYYLGNRYEEVLTTFTHSSLPRISPSFATYHDLLIMLFDSYHRLHHKEKAKEALSLLRKVNQEDADKLVLSNALIHGKEEKVKQLVETQKASSQETRSEVLRLMQEYDQKKKSATKAQALNMIPGLGYWYLGKNKSAFTALALNVITTAAAYQLFRHQHYFAGTLVATLEAGWYFGGIYGAGEMAKLYNERLYEGTFTPLLHKEKLFPIFMLRFGF